MTAVDLKAALVSALAELGIIPPNGNTQAEPVTAQPVALTTAEKRRANLAKARAAKAAKRAAERNGQTAHVPAVQPVTVPATTVQANATVDKLSDPVLKSIYALCVALSQELQNADDPKYRTANVKLWRIRKHANDVPALAGLNGQQITAALDTLCKMGRLTCRLNYRGEPRYLPDVFADFERPTAIPRKASQDQYRSELARRVAAMVGKL